MPRAASTAPVRDRFLGSLLGLAVGDAVGAPYEGLTDADIFFRFGSPQHVMSNPDGDPLFYSDDTQMMIGVAETLLDGGAIDEGRPLPGVRGELPTGEGLRSRCPGNPGRDARRRRLGARPPPPIFPGGSLGNGAGDAGGPGRVAVPRRLRRGLGAGPAVPHCRPTFTRSGSRAGRCLALAVAVASRAECVRP